MTTLTPPAPCGYCRRCAIHDDPGGCLEVAAWERANPEIAAQYLEPWARPLDIEPADADDIVGIVPVTSLDECTPISELGLRLLLEIQD